MQEGPLVLEAPLEGFTAHQVALLLRFIYHPQLITSINLIELWQHLPPLLRLAHKLDVPVLVDAITKHIINELGSQQPCLAVLCYSCCCRGCRSSWRCIAPCQTGLLRHSFPLCSTAALQHTPAVPR